MPEELYALPLAFLLISPILPFSRAHEISIVLCLYLLIKWLSDYRKCTVSFIECKLRGVKKENGYLNSYLDPIINMNRHRDRYLYYGTAVAVISLNIVAQKLPV
jgi:hypothetical protein